MSYDIDYIILNQAIINTFKKRDFSLNIKYTSDQIEKSESLKIRWAAYQRKYLYASNISFEFTIKCIRELLEKIDVDDIQNIIDNKYNGCDKTNEK